MNKSIPFFATLIAWQLAWGSPHSVHQAELEAAVEEAENAIIQQVEEIAVAAAEAAGARILGEQEPKVVRTEVPVYPGVQQMLALSVSGDDSDGCDIPGVSLAYEVETSFDQVDLDAHGRAWTGGNLACADASSADVQVRAAFDRVVVTLGYDRRAVSVQEVDPMAGRVVFYGAAVAETAAIGYELADHWTLGYNVLQAAPRAAYEQDFETMLGPVTVESEVQRFPSTGFVASVRASAVREVGDGWGVTAHVGMTLGLDNVPDPVRWKNDAGLDRGPGAPPTRSHSFGIGVTRTF